ncbi:hypothetical protein MTO96_026428 [Rhipicephalus appendiculatus]
MEAKSGSEALALESKIPATADADADRKVPPKTLESVGTSGKSADTMYGRAKGSKKQRSLSRLSKKSKSVASRRSKRHGKEEGKATEQEEPKTTTSPQRPFVATSPSTPKSGAQSAIGTGQEDAVQTNQDKVAVGGMVSQACSGGAQSAIGAGQKEPVQTNQDTVAVGSMVSQACSSAAAQGPVTCSATVETKKPQLTAAATDEASPLTTRFIGKEALPSTDAKPEPVAQPVPRVQQRLKISQEVPIVPSDIHRDANRPAESRCTSVSLTKPSLPVHCCAGIVIFALGFVALLLYLVTRPGVQGERFRTCKTMALSRYVCDGWRSANDLSVSEDTFQSALNRMYRSLLDEEVPHKGQNALERGIAFYLSCECVGRGECNELQKVKMALREADIVWPRRANGTDLLDALLYTSLRLHWASVLDIELRRSTNATTVFLSIPTAFHRLRSRLVEHIRTPGARKRYFDVLVDNFQSPGDVEDGDVVSFEETHSLELNITTALWNYSYAVKEAEFNAHFMYGVLNLTRRRWADALSHYGVTLNGSDALLFRTNSPAFLYFFLEMWADRGEADMHLFVSWCTVQVAALFANQALQTSFYGSPARAKLGHGVSCYSKALLLVGEEALYAYRREFLPERLRQWAETIVLDVRQALERRLHRWSGYTENITVVGDWNSTSIVLKYFYEAGSERTASTDTPQKSMPLYFFDIVLSSTTL